jgi:hypothetical protein
MIVEPRERQCPSVQKLELNIETLRRVTEEAMKNWFKESPDNAAKEVHLKEIFKVARLEERFRNGEVGKLTWARPSRVQELTRSTRWHSQDMGHALRR